MHKKRSIKVGSLGEVVLSPNAAKPGLKLGLNKKSYRKNTQRESIATHKNELSKILNDYCKDRPKPKRRVDPKKFLSKNQEELADPLKKAAKMRA